MVFNILVWLDKNKIDRTNYYKILHRKHPRSLLEISIAILFVGKYKGTI